MQTWPNLSNAVLVLENNVQWCWINFSRKMVIKYHTHLFPCEEKKLLFCIVGISAATSGFSLNYLWNNHILPFCFLIRTKNPWNLLYCGFCTQPSFNVYLCLTILLLCHVLNIANIENITEIPIFTQKRHSVEQVNSLQ